MIPHSSGLPRAEPSALARKLAARIAAGGPISFHDYMEACLYDPEHGYYKRRNPLGEGGDFITAPEISQVFGELAGLWAGECWTRMGCPPELRLIELGAGRGTLMADAMRALRVLPGFLKSVTIHLVETSETLKAAQIATLADVPCRVFWHNSIEEVPGGAAIAIANEFFDCLPVRQYVFDEARGHWRERMVAGGADGFRFEPGAPAPNGVRGDLHEVTGSIKDGAVVELRPAIGKFMRAFRDRAAKFPFAALIVDYGYSRPSYGDTVQAVARHRFTGVFERPGEADLTAHVDFPDLIEQAEASGLQASNPMPMGEWLLRLGVEARVQQLTRQAGEEKAMEIRSRVSRLIDPKQMGALFKVVALTASGLGSLPPF